MCKGTALNPVSLVHKKHYLKLTARIGPQASCLPPGSSLAALNNKTHGYKFMKFKRLLPI